MSKTDPKSQPTPSTPPKQGSPAPDKGTNAPRETTGKDNPSRPGTNATNPQGGMIEAPGKPGLENEPDRSKAYGPGGAQPSATNQSAPNDTGSKQPGCGCGPEEAEGATPRASDTQPMT